MSLVVRVVAPSGRDAELITDVLLRNGIAAETCVRLAEFLQTRAERVLGPLLIAEEALSSEVVRELVALLARQPEWSDLPFLILTGTRDPQNHSVGERFRVLGSPVLLERPIRRETLVSSVQAALRARQRQYEIRDALRERDAALGELKQERENLQVMIDNLPVGVLLADAEGRVVLGNKSVERILRHPILPTPDVESHSQWEAFHTDGRRLRGEEYPLTRAIKGGKQIPPEDYVYRRGDDTTAWVRLAASPIFNDQGSVVGGVVAISDIDQQKRAETALMQSEKLAAVGRLASSISHEINNPLEAVTNLLYLLEHATPDEQVHRLVTTAQEQLGRVSQIVTQTLRFHRQSTRPREISPEELLEPSLGLYEARLKNAQIRLQLQHRGAGKLMCYEGDIRQVLNNLISNAIDSMRAGGRLVVRTSKARLRKSGVTGVRITIADTGHGIPQKIRRQIFEPFYTTKGDHGTGLGLWISQGIINKHQGRLQIRSKVHGIASGTVASLFLPVQAA